MAAVQSKQDLVDYCLRKLGSPVINIEVAPEQCDDRIDEALETFEEFHFEATENQWLMYELDQPSIDAGFITVPGNIQSVLNILPIGSPTQSTGSNDDARIFSFRYQLMYATIKSWRNFDTLSYMLIQNWIDETKNMFIGTPRFEYSRFQHKLKIYMDLASLGVGYKFGVNATVLIDPVANADVWNSKWLKQYATALIKQQWGNNLKKHESIQLLGGVTLNGQKIYDEATDEIEKLIADLRETYQEPPDFFIG